MTDEELKAKWAKITDLQTAVNEFIAHEDFAASSDPYYMDLTRCLWDMLERALKMPAKVYLVEAEHWFIGGTPRKAFATRELANVEAASLVNMLRKDVDPLKEVGMPATATPSNWEEKLQEARKVRARLFECDPDDLGEDDGDVWITELDVGRG